MVDGRSEENSWLIFVRLFFRRCLFVRCFAVRVDLCGLKGALLVSPQAFNESFYPLVDIKDTWDRFEIFTWYRFVTRSEAVTP